MNINKLKSFILLWLTQALSQLGSTMTSLALGIWLYEKTGSALQSALLNICSYTPYVLVSIFAGALSDKWNKKKTMLICDSLAAMTTLIIFILLKKDLLMPIHMYLLNIINGLMNTFQQPASETAMSVVTPKEYYQKTSGMRSFTRSLITIFAPVLATTIYSLFGIEVVCYFDLFSFGIAFVTLLFFIEIKEDIKKYEKAKMFELVKDGFVYLKENHIFLDIIIFMSGINLVASAFDTTIIPLVLSKTHSETILGIVTSFSGIAMLFGSFIATIMKEPEDKPRTIFLMMFASMLLENFMVALTDSPIIWCIAQILGWLPVPIFSAAYDVFFKTNIPIEMQGRVYSFRNCLQFFTIPIGNFLGGYLVDLFEPIMANMNSGLLFNMFGNKLGSGASLTMFIMGVYGVVHCLLFKNKFIKKV